MIIVFSHFLFTFVHFVTVYKFKIVLIILLLLLDKNYKETYQSFQVLDV